MHLACPQCGAPVEVTSSFANCPACGADVASHYTPTEMTRTVYHRALEHYSMGNEEAALEGIQQGIEVLEAPELYLLAALIYRKRGEFKEMREHVAAIPADDVLRGEGEWLLRSHQEQLQLGRREEARKRGRVKGTQLAVGKASRQFSTEYYPAPLAEKRDSMIGALKVRRNRLPWAIPIAVVLLAVILLTQGAGDSLLSALRQLRSVPDELASVFSSLTRDEPTVDSEAASAPDTGAQIGAAAVQDTPASTPAQPTATPPPAQAGAQSSVATPEPTQISPPTTTVASGETPDVAATIVAAARAHTFDLTTFLSEQARPDLAALDLRASWASGAPPGELTLQGTVTLTSDQIELLQLAAAIEGVTSINHDELVVDLPQTYSVQAGENLRHIASRLYGDSARWTEIYNANQDLIGEDPNNLWVGLSLTVPQEEQTQEEQSQP